MKVVNEIKMSMPAKSVNEGFARAASAVLASQFDPTVDIVADIKTAISEAVTNAVVHAYPQGGGKVYITLRLLEGGIFSATIRDTGVGIADVKLARTPCYTSGGTGERCGMGFSIMETFMDKLRVTSKPGRGTTVTMYKTLS